MGGQPTRDYLANSVIWTMLIALMLLNSATMFGLRVPKGYAKSMNAAATPSFSDPLPTADWSQFHGNYTHNGYSPYPGPLKPGQNWTYNLGGAVTGLVAAGGIISASGPSAGNIVGLNETSGSYLFTYLHGGTCVFLGSAFPAIGAAQTYFVDEYNGCYFAANGFLRADSASTGSATWAVTGLAYSGTLSPYYGYGLVTYYQGSVFEVPFNTATIYGFVASSGSQLWQKQLAGSIDTIPTGGDGKVIVGFSNLNTIAALFPSNGSSIWNFTTIGNVDASPTYSNGYFYFGTLGGYFYKISTNGIQSWRVNIGANIESTPTILNGLVYFGAGDGYIYALHDSDGSQAWKYSAGGTLISSPAVSGNGALYEGSSNDFLYALNAVNGAPIWSSNLTYPITSSPVLDRGFLFVVDGSGLIHAFGYDSAANAYAVTFNTNPTNVGSITFSGTTYINGQSANYYVGSYSLVASPPAGYAFAGWSTTGGVSVANSSASLTTAMVTAPGSLTANFGPSAYSLTFHTNPSSQGSISIGGSSYTNGQSHSFTAGNYYLTAAPPSGSVFEGWSTTGGVSVSGIFSSHTSLDITGVGTLTAYFVAAPSTPVFGSTALALAIAVISMALLTGKVRRELGKK